MNDVIARVLKCRTLAVTGASRYPAKFGHRIFYFLKAKGYHVLPINPNADCLEEETCYGSLDDLPEKPECIVTVTQPWITAKTVNDAIRLGIPYIWMQPGSESRDGIKAAEEAGIGLVYGGPCIMVEYNRASAGASLANGG